MLLLALAALAWGEEPMAPAAVDGLAPLLDAVVMVRQGSGLCAGAFMDAAGHVVTAYHCVSAGGRPQVELRDGRRAVGRVVAWEARTDLAVIHVESLEGAPHLPLRDGPPLQGEAVRAIGHPYAVRQPSGFMQGTLRWTVTEGVVAAVGTRAVQITAAVNPGNSGGPVIDAEGRIVGVVSRRMSGEALGFAGRADRLPHLLEEPRGLGLAGGHAGVGLTLASLSSSTGVLTLGARLEGTLRDRVVASAGLALPLSHRWSAARFESGVSWTHGDVRAGLRQRLGRGLWTVRVDAYGGALFHSHLAVRVEGEHLDFDRENQVRPMVGGAVSLGGSGVDLAWVSLDSGWLVRTQITLSWPGTLWVF